MKDYSNELTEEQKLVKIFTDPLNDKIEKLVIENKKLKKQLRLNASSIQLPTKKQIISEANEFSDKNTHEIDVVSWTHFNSGFLNGCYWYEKQIKSKR